MDESVFLQALKPFFEAFAEKGPSTRARAHIFRWAEFQLYLTQTRGKPRRQEESQSRYSVSEWWLEPRTQGPGAHSHVEDDLFYIIQRVMSIRVGEDGPCYSAAPCPLIGQCRSTLDESSGSAGAGSLWDLNETARFDVVDVSVYRNAAGNQWMAPNALDIGRHAL